MTKVDLKFRTKYPSIIPKGSMGICTVDNGHELKIRFDNIGEFYFYKRDLEKVEGEQ